MLFNEAIGAQIGDFRRLINQGLVLVYKSHRNIPTLIKCTQLCTTMRSPRCISLLYDRSIDLCEMSTDLLANVTASGVGQRMVFSRYLGGEFYNIDLISVFLQIYWLFIH